MNARAKRGIGLGCGAAALAAMGCAQVFGVTTDRHLVASDAGGAAPAVDGGGNGGSDGGVDWSCLGGPPIPAASGNVVLSVFLNDVSNASTTDFAGTPVPDALMQACSTDDITCIHPVSSATSDDAGVANISVPAGFNGYYQVTASSAYTPAILSRSAQQESEAAQQGIANAQLLSVAGSLSGVNVNANESFVIVTAADCASNPALGVEFTVGTPGSDEQLIYLLNNLPSKSSTATDLAGSAILFNVPAGAITLSATVASTHQPLRAASVTALVRQGWVTFVQIRPDGAKYPAP